jgi:hypothetical protein
MDLREFWISAAITFVLGTLGITGVALSGHHIAYWLAYVIAAVLVYGGFLVLDGEWID